MTAHRHKFFASLSIAIPLAGGAIAQTSVTTTTTAGTISEFSPETIVIRSETSPEGWATRGLAA
jgi:hypothetical protein